MAWGLEAQVVWFDLTWSGGLAFCFLKMEELSTCLSAAGNGPVKQGEVLMTGEGTSGAGTP